MDQTPIQQDLQLRLGVYNVRWEQVAHIDKFTTDDLINSLGRDRGKARTNDERLLRERTRRQASRGCDANITRNRSRDRWIERNHWACIGRYQHPTRGKSLCERPSPSVERERPPKHATKTKSKVQASRPAWYDIRRSGGLVRSQHNFYCMDNSAKEGWVRQIRRRKRWSCRWTRWDRQRNDRRSEEASAPQDTGKSDGSLKRSTERLFFVWREDDMTTKRLDQKGAWQ